MKIYKYLNFSKRAHISLCTVQQLIFGPEIWCSKPIEFNDRWEFTFHCDYTPSSTTIYALEESLIRFQGLQLEAARESAIRTLVTGRLEEIARPHITRLIELCKREAGVACFGTRPDNEVLWTRYACSGDGACVEIDVDDHLYNTVFYRVNYVPKRRIHIDEILQALGNTEKTMALYRAMLTTKTIRCIDDQSICWSDEQEVRFISKKQDSLVGLDRSATTKIFLGNKLSQTTKQNIQNLIAASSHSILVEQL